MKDQFVTYEIAKKLKELGFNEECFGYFYMNYNRYSITYPESSFEKWYTGEEVLAPIWQQAEFWLENTHHIDLDKIHVNLPTTTDYWQIKELRVLKALELITKKD